MKIQFQKWELLGYFLLTIGALLIISSCNKDDDNKPKTEPMLTTAEVIDITTISATGGGEITDNGGNEVTAAGLVYSDVVAEPTLADDKVTVTATAGSFTTMLENLTSGTTYYVRAYATNEIGTGYGDAVNFTTGNAAPTATSVSISGTMEANSEITAVYTYNDNESDAEGTSTFQWYVADDNSGTNEAAITSATTESYTISADYEDKFIAVGVTPVSVTGNTTGEEVKSTYFGVGEATTVTFIYNGEEVTYGILTSAETGRKWLDRNLGAAAVPTAVDDYANYGDMFQWGRLADGHQLIERTGPNDGNATGVNGVTTTEFPYDEYFSSTDDPGHPQFITTDGAAPNDWRSPQNNDLWQGVDGVNNPCPDGWRLPTDAELTDESFTDIEDAFSKLNLTLTGFRSTGGSFSSSTSVGFYWSSSIGTNDQTRTAAGWINTSYSQLEVGRAFGAACRCIKD